MFVCKYDVRKSLLVTCIYYTIGGIIQTLNNFLDAHLKILSSAGKRSILESPSKLKQYLFKWSFAELVKYYLNKNYDVLL